MYEQNVAKQAHTGGANRLAVTRSLSGVVADLDPDRPMAVADGPQAPPDTPFGNGLVGRVTQLEQRAEEDRREVVLALQHVDTRLRRIEKAIGL